MANSFYDLSAIDDEGNCIKFSKYAGKVVIVCNIATKCSFSGSNLENLAALATEYSNKALSILLWPCNDFWGQEPGSACDITTHLDNYFDKFEVFEKTRVRDGSNEVFNFLTKNSSGLFGSSIKWNYTKFVINKEGLVVERYSPYKMVPSAVIKRLIEE